MGSVIDEYLTDSSTAFAHSISEDFEASRHMSAGVAVIFRNRFGRPKNTDKVNTKLTMQKVQGGTTVYSLLTKSKYNGKPEVADYDLAFKQLEEHFKSNNSLKTLICSPIGCVRDLVQVHHFAHNIVEFQRHTRAMVYIISCDQPSAQRPLWGGLSHSQFLAALQEEISKKQEQLIKHLLPQDLHTKSQDSSVTDAELPITDLELNITELSQQHLQSSESTLSPHRVQSECDSESYGQYSVCDDLLTDLGIDSDTFLVIPSQKVDII